MLGQQCTDMKCYYGQGSISRSLINARPACLVLFNFFDMILNLN